MLDLNFVRENLDAVREGLRSRNFPDDALDKFVELDTERRRIIAEADEINRQRNAASKEIGSLMQTGKREEAEAKKAEVGGLKDRQTELESARDDADRAMRDLLAGLPNIPANDVPIGADELANKEVRRWGEPREFDFEPKDHVDLGEALGILDLERASKIAGSRFSILNGAGARLERALLPPVAIKREQRVHFASAQRPSIGTARERRQNAPSASLLRCGAGSGESGSRASRTRRVTGENAASTRRVARARRIERSRDGQELHVRPAGGVVRSSVAAQERPQPVRPLANLADPHGGHQP